MSKAQELYDEWTSGESNGMRIQRVQALREDFESVTGLSFPHRITELEAFVETMSESGVITRKLQVAAEASDDEDSEE